MEVICPYTVKNGNVFKRSVVRVMSVVVYAAGKLICIVTFSMNITHTVDLYVLLLFQTPIKKPMVMTRDKQQRKDAVDVFKCMYIQQNHWSVFLCK